MNATRTLPPLVAYYGTLTQHTLDDGPVASLIEAEQVIPTLPRTPVLAVTSGDYLGDYLVMVPVPYVLPNQFGDDEYTFEVDIFSS